MSVSDTGTTTGWRRPPGPVNVWKVVDGELELDDGTKRPVKFSIQEVPEDRREEIIDFMLKYFLNDEPTSKSLNAKNDPKIVHDYCLAWNYILKQGIVEAAYLLDSTLEKPELVAVNMLYVESKEVEKEMEQWIAKLESLKIMEFLGVTVDMKKRADPYKILKTDKYIGAIGLVVASHIRGQKLGLRMLEARSDIGRKYGIPATSTLFTAHVSQILAERAGFKNELTVNYADIVDGDGKPLFPNIESKCMKLMMKRF